MEWGPKLETLIAQKAQGGYVPALDNRPTLENDLQWFYQHYSQLTRERKYAHDTPLPLYLSDIDLYWRRFVGFDFEDFYEQVTFIDGIYLKLLADNREAKAKASNKKVVHTGPAR